MNIKVRVPKEITEFIERNGNAYNDGNGNIYRNLPFWYRETEEKGVYELLYPNQMPVKIMKEFEQLYWPKDMVDEATKEKVQNYLNKDK